MTKTVAIIGGGFYGVSVANTLAKLNSDVKIKLISVSKYAYFFPSSTRAVVENDPQGTLLPLKDLVKGHAEIVIGEVTEFDEEKVTLKNGDTVTFDVLVVATGSKWNEIIGTTKDFGDDYKTYIAKQSKKIEEAKDIVLVGGGFVNAELAGELQDRYAKELKSGEKRVSIVHNSDKLLPNSGHYSDKLRERVTYHIQHNSDVKLYLNSTAQISSTNSHEVIIGDETIKADLIISFIGCTPSVPPTTVPGLLNAKGAVQVLDSFLASGSAKGNIFSVGDCNDFSFKGLILKEKWVPVLARNIIKYLNNPSVSKESYEKVERKVGNVMGAVTYGKNYGFGQAVLPLIGTVNLPGFVPRSFKSKDALRGRAKEIFTKTG